MTETPSPTPSPAPTSWAPVRASTGVLGGVCGGLAVAAGVEVTLVRLAFVAAGLAGFGIIAYIILWLVLPRESPQRPLVPAPPETAKWLSVGLLIAAVVGLLSLVGSFPWFGAWGPADFGAKLWLGLILMAIGGLVLWSNRRTPSSATPASSVVLASSMPGSTLPPPSGQPIGATTQPVTTAQPVRPAGGPSPTAPSSGGGAGLLIARVVGWFALLTAVPAVLALLLAQSFGVLDVVLPGLVWTLLVVSLVGLFTVLIAVRHAWVVATAIAVLLVSTLVAASLTRFDGTVGQRIETPTSPDELVVPDMAAGHLVLDLTSFDQPEGTATIPIDMGVGRVDVIVPDGVTVNADVSVGAGEARVFGTSRDGLSVEVTRTSKVEGATSTLDLDIELRAGLVQVCRSGPGTGGVDGCGPA